MKTAQTLAEVAKHFGKHPSTIKTWRSQGMPGEPSHYDLDAIADWREQQTVDPLAEMREEKLAAEIELKRHQAEIARLKAQQIAGASIPRRWVEQRLVDRMLEAISYSEQNNFAVANSKMRAQLEAGMNDWYALNDPHAGTEVTDGDDRDAEA